MIDFMENFSNYGTSNTYLADMGWVVGGTAAPIW
jgi:hypothetical protein